MLKDMKAYAQLKPGQNGTSRLVEPVREKAKYLLAIVSCSTIHPILGEGTQGSYRDPCEIVAES